jgi:hypothetical protein
LTSFDKDKVKEQLTLEQVFELLQEWGGDPQYTDYGILSSTICHNRLGGSRKLYYYDNSKLFQCYTGCGSFDLFELTIKIFSLQYDKEINLDTAIRYIAAKFGIAGEYVEEDNSSEDWHIFESYSRIREIETKDYHVELKTYDIALLDRFNYQVKLTPWLEEEITQEVLDYAHIGFYPGADQITIPHFDANNRLVGLRGRALAQEEVEKWGKYRPLRLNKDLQFNHPLGMNLYGLNWAKDNIAIVGKAIIFEGERNNIALVHFSRWPARVN